jgi:hypothetical protein
MKRAWWLIPIGFLLGGCSSGERLFPMQVGNTWTYQVKNGMAEFVQPVKLVRTVPVNGVEGYELSSPMGFSRLAWKDRVLYGSVFSNLRANPPIPMLDARRDKTELKWKGRVFFSGKPYDALGELQQEPFKKDAQGRERKGIRTTLTIQFDGKSMEIQTWYVPNVGPISQVQRTFEGRTERFDVSLDLLTGP